MTRRELQPNELEQLSLYAFGLLDAEAAARVDARLERDPAWRAELGLMQGTLAELAEPGAVPVGAAGRLLERVRQDQALTDQAPTGPTPASPANLKLSEAPKPRAPYGPLLALALTAAVIAGLVLFPRLTSQTPEQQLGRYQAEPGAATTALKTKDGQNLGTAVRLKDGRTFVLLAANAPEGRAYQAWQVIGAAPRSLGVFKGRSFLSTPIAGKVVFAVSVEPPAGSPQPTTTPILAQEL
jgi:anti-sigma-K factor RskA